MAWTTWAPPTYTSLSSKSHLGGWSRSQVRISVKMSKEGDFDDIIDDLGGLGKYQIRLLVLLLGINNIITYSCTMYCLLGPLFFIMPFPLLHQVFVLHSPLHNCTHPDRLSPQTVGIDNITVWNVSFFQISYVLSLLVIIFIVYYLTSVIVYQFLLFNFFACLLSLIDCHLCMLLVFIISCLSSLIIFHLYCLSRLVAFRVWLFSTLFFFILIVFNL